MTRFLCSARKGTSPGNLHYSGYIAQLLRFNDIGIKPDEIVDMFSELTTRQLLIDKNEDLYTNPFNIVIADVTDLYLFNEISYLYNYNMGKVLFLDNRYNEAQPFIENAFNYRPDDTNVRAMFYGVMLAQLEDLKYGDSAYSLEKFENYFIQISQLKQRHTQLNSMIGFRKAWLFFCLGLMEQYYNFDDVVNGEKYKFIFEHEYPLSLKGFSGINKGIVNAYSSAAAYYKRNEDIPKSMEVVYRGLDYIPENRVLVSLIDQK